MAPRATGMAELPSPVIVIEWGMFRMSLHSGSYHSHSQAELSCSGFQPQSLEHINAQDILRNGGHINSTFTGGQLPNTQGKPCSLLLYTAPPLQNLSKFPYRRVHSASVSTRASTCWTFVGDQWMTNSTRGLWSLSVPCRWTPQPSSYSKF